MNKVKHCSGCGVALQDENILKLGYTINMDNDLCMRCYRLQHYGEYESVSSSLVDYPNILEMVNNSHDLVLYVVDIINIPVDLNMINEYLTNDIVLVINKRDLLPISVKD